VPGHPFLRSLDEAEGPIDVALIVRPAEECPAAVADVSRLGIPFAIVYAAGFSELGEEGQHLERQMVAMARGRTRLVGPNGMNIFSAPARLNLSAISPFPSGGVGFLSASGNLAYALAHEASRRGDVGFSRFVSAGNQADLALDEYLDFLSIDDETGVVLIYVEGLAQGRARAFVDAVARTAAVKPVLLLRGGRTRVGQQTARSHTGALAGEAEVARQAFEQAGAVLIDRADEALTIARAFLESPLPRGPRVALVGEGGGHATLLSDAAVEAGLQIEPFPEAMVDGFRGALPPFVGILRNPVEFGGRSEYDPRVYERVLGPVLDWDGCDLAILFGGYALYDDALVSFLIRRREETGKPILLHDLYADEDRPALRHVREGRLPLFASGEMAVRVAAALARAGRGRQRAQASLEFAGLLPPPARPLPHELRVALALARGRLDGALLEDEAARLLAHFGVPMPRAVVARDPDDAVRTSDLLGFPIVLKIHTAEIVHKSDIGGVHLDLRSADDVRRAYDAVGRLVVGRPEVRLTPFLPGGIEAIVGARRDPEFGPLVVFGAGGVTTESAGDVAIRTLPCPKSELAAMVEETRTGRQILGGARGATPAEVGAVVDVLLAVSHLILSVPDVADVELNPLRCAADGVIGLDARALVRP
jgi:acetyltransferase